MISPSLKLKTKFEIFLMSANAIWLIICTVIAVSLAGSSALANNFQAVMLIIMIPVILASIVTNFLIENSIKSLISLAFAGSSKSEVKNKLAPIVRTVFKIGRMILFYVIFSSLMARIFADTTLTVFIITSIFAIFLLSKSMGPIIYSNTIRRTN